MSPNPIIILEQSKIVFLPTLLQGHCKMNYLSTLRSFTLFYCILHLKYIEKTNLPFLHEPLD